VIVKSGDSGSLRLYLELREACARVSLILRREVAARWEIGIMEYELLAHIHASPVKLNQTQLARCMMVTLAYVSYMGRNLTRAGLIERSGGTDRRLQLLELTEQGLHCVRRLSRQHERLLKSLLDGLSDSEYRSLLRLLSSVKNQLIQQERQG
jgi:DNA-binding MarR family transcriptional regulator